MNCRLLIAAPMLALVACSRIAPPTEPELRPVRAMTVAAAPSTARVELAGAVRPRIESRLGFQVGGRIASRVAEVGQAVRQGQLLATLDAADYRLALAAAQAQREAARVERDMQRADFRRFEQLHRQGFIGGAELERRRSTLEAAEARFDQSQAQANVAGNQADYASLRAPRNGVITAVDAEPGQVVAAGQSVVRLALGGEPEVEVAIPEGRLAALRLVKDVRVSLWAQTGELRGRVREIAPLADAATRTYPVRITLIDPPPTVALGMSAHVIFELPVGAAIAVPLTALLHSGGETYVWQLDRVAMKVRRQAVKVVSVSGNDVVIGAGVAPGAVLVTAGVHLLKDGQKVKLLDPQPAAAR